MADFQIYDEQTAPEGSRAILAEKRKAYGFLPNLLGELAESPAALEGYTRFSEIFDKTSFTPAERQIVILATSYENACHYCMAAHSTAAKGAKLDPAAIEALRSGSALPDARQEALAQFTRVIVRERGWAKESDIQAFLDAGFTKANIFEVIMGVSLKTLSNYVNHIGETPLDAPFKPQEWRKAA